ncbi:hypothetical protein FGIG_08391 [Fasciola gigantica]|uniref:Uncharacterized protein n=1 Tax=Fasciola gigantica TaxID=46835 RepID=A0A504Z3L7_FASGI|nr:hypothetical protein FGIG_08391 [Fasciola gigantica]
MSRLERISVSVHDTRRRQTMNSNQSSSPPSSIRGQGVGAESVESFVELACPGADIFSSSPRLNEKTIFPPDSPPNNPVISLATNFHPFVNGLLQHVQDTAAQLIACDNSIRLNSPPNQITDPAPRPAPNSISSCSQTRSQPSSYIQSNSDTAADLHFVADHTKSNIQSCRCVQRSFVNSSSSDIWDCLPIPQHMQETFLSSAFSTLYMKRAHSSSELPTSCVEF